MTAIVRRRLVLHVGQTKAGSTAIQNYLDAERAALSEQGILVPRTGFSRSNRFYPDRTSGHLALMRAIHEGETKALREEVDSRSFETVVLSAENILFERPDNELEAFARFFDGYDIEILGILRAHQSWIQSRYIENVLSAFIGTEATFSEFCAEIVATRTHDYAARLDHLAGIFGARSVRAVNYDAAVAGEGLVPAVLQAAGLPLTDPDLATTITANVREKELFLVEGKRRLNHVHTRLPKPVRQELERDIRRFAQDLAAGLPAPPAAFSDIEVPLPASACRDIARSNARLIDAYGLAPPLPDPEPRTVSLDLHLRDIDGADDLVRFGLLRMAELLRADASETGPQPHFLSLDGAETLIDAILAAPVIVDVDAPDIAVTAACFPGKLAIHLASATRLRRALPRLTSARLPSQIVTLDRTDALASVTADLPADLVIASATAEIAQIRAALACASPRAEVFLFGAEASDLTEIALTLDRPIADHLGQVVRLAPRPVPARKKDPTP